MLTISRLAHRSIKYYNDTAAQAKHAATKHQSAGGGLAEYYSEGETRLPSWLVVGDKQFLAHATGLGGSALDGGNADTEAARVWLDDGRAPNGVAGREFSDKSVHGFDLTFSAPKSVSLIRALADDVAEKVLATAHTQPVDAAIEYLHRHAGYTRVHNPVTGNKDLQRLPGRVAVAYQHETSRCGDPHLHTHVIVPNRQPRADGHLVSLDSKSLYHEAKAAGIIYQATLRHLLHAERGFEFHPVDPHTGMAEIAGVAPDCIKSWSRRSTKLRVWARNNLVVGDGAPPAAQLAAAQKATRPTKPESLSWADLKQQWRADARGLRLDRDAHIAARTERRTRARSALDVARTADIVAHIDKPTFTRADMVELIGAQLPIDAIGEPRALIEQIVDGIGVRISAPREAHQREGSERFTLEAIIAEEEHILGMVDESETGHASTCASRTSVICRPTNSGRSATSPYHPPWCSRCRRRPGRARRTLSRRCAPLRTAHAKKCSSWRRPARPSTKPWPKALATTASPSPKHCTSSRTTSSTSTGRRWSWLTKRPWSAPLTSRSCSRAPLQSARKWCWSATPISCPPSKRAAACSNNSAPTCPGAKASAKSGAWPTQKERDTSLALRSAHGNRLRTAVRWYRDHGRLHSGDPIAMASDALDAYLTDRNAGKDALLVCDTWEMADALNRRLHDTLTASGPTVAVARGQLVTIGDIVMSRSNDITIDVRPAVNQASDGVDQVRNGNRWRVAAIDPNTNRIAAERLSDGARAVFEGEYLTDSVTLGYAATVHSAQGVTADSSYALLGEGASRPMLYVAMTRGRHNNETFLYQRFANEADHNHTRPTSGQSIHLARRGNKYSAAHHFRAILANDNRQRTMHAEAERTARHLLPEMVCGLLERQDHRGHTRQRCWQEHLRSVDTRQAGYARMAAAARQGTGLDMQTEGLEL